ncbi:MAG: carbohydrate-binding family 9-like protein [Bacteroidales bacterium]|nr:carbohydrate-binding family 9-like protein [Bacteroidales bacterium]
MRRTIIYHLRLKRIHIVLVCLLTGLSLYSQPEKQLVTGQQPVYKVSKARGSVTVDGKMDEPDWKNAEVQTLNNFFRLDKPVEKQNSRFRMLWDDANLYLFYECEDTSLTARETNFDGRTYIDDCAEFFVVPVPDSIYMHFGFEINITEVRYDYIVLWKFYNNRTFFISGYNPEYKVKAICDGTINDEKDQDRGWTMEFAIPFSAFSNFQNVTRPKSGARWAFQVVRQDRNSVNDRFRSTSTLFPIYVYRLDVHQPNRFGLFEFTDN